MILDCDYCNLHELSRPHIETCTLLTHNYMGDQDKEGLSPHLQLTDEHSQ